MGLARTGSGREAVHTVMAPSGGLVRCRRGKPWPPLSSLAAFSPMRPPLWWLETERGLWRQSGASFCHRAPLLACPRCAVIADCPCERLGWCCPRPGLGSGPTPSRLFTCPVLVCLRCEARAECEEDDVRAHPERVQACGKWPGYGARTAL